MNQNLVLSLYRYTFEYIKTLAKMKDFKFTLTIEKNHPTEIIVIEVLEFITRAEAKKAIRVIIKKYNMVKHSSGHIINFSEGVELYTNF